LALPNRLSNATSVLIESNPHFAAMKFLLLSALCLLHLHYQLVSAKTSAEFRNEIETFSNDLKAKIEAPATATPAAAATPGSTPAATPVAPLQQLLKDMNDALWDFKKAVKQERARYKLMEEEIEEVQKPNFLAKLKDQTSYWRTVLERYAEACGVLPKAPTQAEMEAAKKAEEKKKNGDDSSESSEEPRHRRRSSKRGRKPVAKPKKSWVALQRDLKTAQTKLRKLSNMNRRGSKNSEIKKVKHTISWVQTQLKRTPKPKPAKNNVKKRRS